jgi:hypothetical protein
MSTGEMGGGGGALLGFICFSVRRPRVVLLNRVLFLSFSLSEISEHVFTGRRKNFYLNSPHYQLLAQDLHSGQSRPDAMLQAALRFYIQAAFVKSKLLSFDNRESALGVQYCSGDLSLSVIPIAVVHCPGCPWSRFEPHGRQANHQPLNYATPHLQRNVGRIRALSGSTDRERT